MNATQPCIFCLEPTQTVKPTILTCPCKFQAHAICWQSWKATKQNIECPICHLTVVPNPIIVVIQAPPEQAQEQVVVYRESKVVRALVFIAAVCISTFIMVFYIFG